MRSLIALSVMTFVSFAANAEDLRTQLWLHPELSCGFTSGGITRTEFYFESNDTYRTSTGNVGAWVRIDANKIEVYMTSFGSRTAPELIKSFAIDALKTPRAELTANALVGTAGISSTVSCRVN